METLAYYIIPISYLVLGFVALTFCFFYVRYRQRLHKKGILDFKSDGFQQDKKEFGITITYGRNRVKRMK